MRHFTIFLYLGPLAASVIGANAYDRLGYISLNYWTIPMSTRASVVVDGCP